MSDFQWQDGKGALFVNDKGGNDSRPDVRGEAMVHGKLMQISGWYREGKKGKFLSLNIQSSTKDATNTKSKGGMEDNLTAPAPADTGYDRSEEKPDYGHPEVMPAAMRGSEGAQPQPQKADFDDDIPF
jgi:hypothetical protein